VSSTCYDLAQVRADLRDFAESFGFEPILSEFDSFPVDPNENTLNNCLEAVRNRADVFLLIVGGRYGSLTDTGQSITNLEFLEAKAKGIPKYVFVKSEILSILPVWGKNPSADFSNVVDTTKLFEFVSELRSSGEIWVFPFSAAQDITRILRKQLSYLFADSLQIRRRLYGGNEQLAGLRPKALRLAVEKPLGWEFLLLAQLLSDEIARYRSKRLDAELGISFGEPIVLEEFGEIASWISSRMNWAGSTIEHLSKAINAGLKKAVGELGQPGDVQRIMHIATRVGEGYEQLLDWKLQFLRVSSGEEFSYLINLASDMTSNAIREIEEFASNLYSKIEEHISNVDSNQAATVVTLTLTLTAPSGDEFRAELKRLGAIYG
jgi:hypothetical protein